MIMAFFSVYRSPLKEELYIKKKEKKKTFLIITNINPIIDLLYIVVINI